MGMAQGEPGAGTLGCGAEARCACSLVYLPTKRGCTDERCGGSTFP